MVAPPARTKRKQTRCATRVAARFRNSFVSLEICNRLVVLVAAAFVEAGFSPALRIAALRNKRTGKNPRSKPMARVKRGTKRRARRKKYLKRTKGFFLTKSKLYQSAQEAAN